MRGVPPARQERRARPEPLLHRTAGGPSHRGDGARGVSGWGWLGPAVQPVLEAEGVAENIAPLDLRRRAAAGGEAFQCSRLEGEPPADLAGGNHSMLLHRHTLRI